MSEREDGDQAADQLFAHQPADDDGRDDRLGGHPEHRQPYGDEQDDHDHDDGEAGSAWFPAPV
ncbi:hypothetical protein [Streptomyces sp. NPDC004376]